MIGSIVIALVLWVGFVLLSLWLVSRIARTRMVVFPKGIKVHYSFKRCRSVSPDSNTTETVLDEE